MCRLSPGLSRMSRNNPGSNAENSARTLMRPVGSASMTAVPVSLVFARASLVFVAASCPTIDTVAP